MIYILLIISLLIMILIYFFVKYYMINWSLLGKAAISICLVIFTLSVVVNPRESFIAASDGFKTWFNIVCPSLLPFFIGSELLVNFGIVNFLGILLEPVMRPVFNVPGCGSFPFIMSITSGYPVGAKIVSQIYGNKMCTKAEAQRMLSFCSTSGPLFMTGAVAIGMLNLSSSGPVIALSNYLGAISVGILFRFYKRTERDSYSPDSNIISRAFKSLSESFNKEKRPFGLMLSESVINSMNTLLMIGGIIVLFSVIINLLSRLGVVDFAANILYMILSPLGVDRQLLTPAAAGLFEITIGSKMIAASGAGLAQKIIAISCIIAWSGFSIHAQCAGVLSSTDLSLSTYILSKLLHTVATGIFAYILISAWGINEAYASLPAFSFVKSIIDPHTGWAARFMLSTGRYVFILLILILFSTAYFTAFKIYRRFSH